MVQRAAVRDVAGWWATLAWTRLADRMSLLLGSAAIAWCFLHAHARLAPAAIPDLEWFRAPGRPGLTPDHGWWSWWDQGRYLESALAWARLDLDPARHWYPSAYPLLGAAFARITPSDPFLIPNLAYMAGSMLVFARLAAELADRRPLSASLGAWVFVATMAVPDRALWSWILPWTTTPATPCVLLSLLGTVRFVRDGRAAAVLVASLGVGGTLAFRPADGAIIGAVCAAASVLALLARPPGWPRTRTLAAAALGGLLPVAAALGAYLAVHGPHLNGYLRVSGRIGFEWRLLPLRWITLVIDPKPVLADGEGLAHAFPWIACGVAGMAAALVALRRTRVAAHVHATVIAAAAGYTLVFLCYRDIHPEGLWRFGLYHYFKWTLPLLGLYAVLLARMLAFGPRLAAAGCAAAVMLGLFMWRAEETDPVALPPPTSPYVLDLPQGLPRIDDILLVRVLPGTPGRPDRGATCDQYGLTALDIHLTYWADMLMVQPVRVMPTGARALCVSEAALDQAFAPVVARQSAVWGIPCWWRPERTACHDAFLVPARTLPPDGRALLGRDAGDAGYVARGFSGAEPGGRWTDARHAALSFRLPPRDGRGPLAIALTGHGFVPPGQPPVRADILINGEPSGQVAFGPEVSTQRVAMPPTAAALRKGNVWLELVVANPRRPSDYGPVDDERRLGIMVRGIEVSADGAR